MTKAASVGYRSDIQAAPAWREGIPQADRGTQCVGRTLTPSTGTTGRRAHGGPGTAFRQVLSTGGSGTAGEQRIQCVGEQPAASGGAPAALGLREPTGRDSELHRVARRARLAGYRVPLSSTGEPLTGGSACDVHAAYFRQEECDWSQLGMRSHETVSRLSACGWLGRWKCPRNAGRSPNPPCHPSLRNLSRLRGVQGCVHAALVGRKTLGPGWPTMEFVLLRPVEHTSQSLTKR